MSALSAELSSLATALDDLAGRITRLAEDLRGEDAQSLGPGLYEVERTLLAAGRRLSKVVDEARP